MGRVRDENNRNYIIYYSQQKAKLYAQKLLDELIYLKKYFKSFLNVYCVNNSVLKILIDNNIGKIIPDCLYDSQYKEWSAEQVYEHLNNTLGTNGKSYEQALQDLIDKMVDSHCAGNLPGDDDDESERLNIGESIKLDITDVNDLNKSTVDLMPPPVLEFEVLS